VPKIKGKGKPLLKIGAKNKKIAINVPQLGTIYIDEREFITGLTGGSLPSLTGGAPPSLTGGTLPTLDQGTLPSLNKGKLPSLTINFLNANFKFNKGQLPSLSKGTLPSLNAGSLPTINPGSFPKLKPGGLPKPSKSRLPVPNYSSQERFDPNSKPASIYKDYEVDWKDDKVSVDFSTFKPLPITFGMDKQNYRFYVQIGQKKYTLNGKLF
jgi:hypothetical protein